MMSRGSSTDGRVALTPLRQWSEGESGESIISATRTSSDRDRDAEGKHMLLRKTTVAYGIAELMLRTRIHHRSGFPQISLDEQCNIDNFVVRTKAPNRGSQRTWKDIEGVDMLTPRMSVNIIEPSYLAGGDDDGQEDDMGGYLEAEFPYLPESDDVAVFVNQSEEDNRCHLFGVLLHELFFCCPPPSVGSTRLLRRHNKGDGSESVPEDVNASPESARKKTRLLDLPKATSFLNFETSEQPHKSSHTLEDRRVPSSLHLVIQNLLDCGERSSENAYDSLNAAIHDFHLLLFDPSRFLFDKKPTYDDDGKIKLSFRERQMYGRENEVSLITDAFCRVTGGAIESFFIGGFSGSGKSTLVNGLTERVNMVGGYVLAHKFDQMSTEKPMLEVIALFNDLCLLIREKSSQEGLLVIVNDLIRDFGSDLSILARLLPNIKVLSPQLISADDEQESDNQMNLQSISFTLQRFIRAISTETNPVVLFLDDLQWCDNSALQVVESILCGASGSRFLLLIGTYRSNEVSDDHEIFCIAERLKSSGVPTTMVKLEGLNPKDLNTMISDALCVFPRISEPLSDIVYQKTKGNPFFVLAFLRSLVDRGLIEYNNNTKKWVWDEDDVSYMDITGNVLHLLSSKMSGLSRKIQSALKGAACFGMKLPASVITILSIDPEYAGIDKNLEQVVKEGFMVKVGTSDFKFVHDKVREAAYSLIPENDKDQYHYSLGKSLYSMTEGEVVDDILFSIADQIKHGIVNLAEGEDPKLRIGFAKLFELAGMKAAASSDHFTSRSYLTCALSLLPIDRWKSHYDLSLRFSLRLAESCNACGDIEKAQSILEEMTPQCHSIEDKVPAHVLLARIHIIRKMFGKACTLCHELLFQLGEKIPESFHQNQIAKMVEATSGMVYGMEDIDLLRMDEMDESHSISMNLYSMIIPALFFSKPEVVPFVACRMVQLTMKHGISKHSIVGFVQLAAALSSINNTGQKNIEDASRIGKAAMSCCRNRYNLSDQPSLYIQYYGLFAWHSESLQTCAEMLRQGFDAAMSVGETGTACLISVHHIKTAIIAGERLPALLEKVDYYSERANNHQHELAKFYLSIFQGTISTLMNNGQPASSTSHENNGLPTERARSNMLQAMYFHSSIQSFWQGHNERCQYYMDKMQESSSDLGKLNNLYSVFIHGVISFQSLKKNTSTKIRASSKRAIRVLKVAAKNSCWNFQNKVQLLEAEEFSRCGNNHRARSSYAASIDSARTSGFIHEQGLACELAGYHCRNSGDCSSAWNFFNQAKQCYTQWGSQMKADSVTIQLDALSDYTPVESETEQSVFEAPYPLDTR